MDDDTSQLARRQRVRVKRIQRIHEQKEADSMYRLNAYERGLFF